MTVVLCFLAFLAGAAWGHSAREARVGRTMHMEASVKAEEGKQRHVKYEWRSLFYLAGLIIMMILAYSATR